MVACVQSKKDLNIGASSACAHFFDVSLQTLLHVLEIPFRRYRLVLFYSIFVGIPWVSASFLQRMMAPMKLDHLVAGPPPSFVFGTIAQKK